MTGSMSLQVLLGDAVTMMTPLLFAALGGLFTELAGMLNIALEGLIMIGAFAGVVAAAKSGSLLVGVAAGMVAGMAAALLYGLVSLKLKSNEFIAGLATNLFAAGSKSIKQKVWFPSISRPCPGSSCPSCAVYPCSANSYSTTTSLYTRAGPLCSSHGCSSTRLPRVCA